MCYFHSIEKANIAAPFVCLECDNTEFVIKPGEEIVQEFRGETFKVKCPVYACANCGWFTLNAKQADELRRLTADAHKKANGLLTSEDLKSLRSKLNMNQVDFAAFLGVGAISVKRWETWKIQEKKSDDLIREKCKNL